MSEGISASSFLFACLVGVFSPRGGRGRLGGGGGWIFPRWAALGSVNSHLLISGCSLELFFRLGPHWPPRVAW